MINIIKRLVSYIIIQIRYWNKLKFPISARIGVRSHFEGANRIYERSFFSGSMGYGSYIAAASYIAGKVGRFTSIAQEVKCNPGCHPYTYPFATTSPMFFSTLKQNGHSFSRKQLYEELRYVDGTGDAVHIGSDCWIGDRVFIVGGVTELLCRLIKAGQTNLGSKPQISVFIFHDGLDHIVIHSFTYAI